MSSQLLSICKIYSNQKSRQIYSKFNLHLLTYTLAISLMKSKQFIEFVIRPICGTYLLRKVPFSIVQFTETHTQHIPTHSITNLRTHYTAHNDICF